MALTTIARPGKRAWKTGAAFFAGTATVIGILSGTTDLLNIIKAPWEDVSVKMLPDATDTIAFDARHLVNNREKMLKAGTIILDGIRLALQDGSLIIANRLEMRNGAAITGRRINVVAMIIEGGSITASGEDGVPGALTPPPGKNPTAGSSGGIVVVAAASIAGTPIRVDGGRGGDGARGSDGAYIPNAANGIDGDCAGFGRYHGNTDGVSGREGNRGADGQAAAPGGDGGNLLLLIPKAYPPPPATASKGQGGIGGQVGAGGPGQLGGTGGGGCVGLGGSQGRARDGSTGKPGSPGTFGASGADGHDGTYVIRHVAFQDVERAWRSSKGDTEVFVTALRTLPPG